MIGRLYVPDTDRLARTRPELLEQEGVTVRTGTLPDGSCVVVARDGHQTYRITGPDLYQALVELAVQTGFELEG